MRKDSKKFLQILLKKRNETQNDVLDCNIDEFSEIPNIRFNTKTILDDLKAHGCIGNESKLYIGGNMGIYLTMEGIGYFDEAENDVREVQMNNHINNFYGSVSNMQIQQGTTNSNQTQSITIAENIDFDKVGEFIASIKKYDSFLESEYGGQAVEVREKLQEIESLVQKRENPNRIKLLLTELKNLSIGVGGSLIASGIYSQLQMLFG